MAQHPFLSRWSRKKAGITEELTPAQSTLPVERVNEPSASPKSELGEVAQSSADQTQQQTPPPTIEDVERIDVKSPDFSAFMRPDVDPVVQQAALRKMFSDPHFNVMDGLDIYIDDYTKSDPIPLDMLKRMQQSELLGLFKSAEELYPENKEASLEQVHSDQTKVDEHPQTEESSQPPSIANQDNTQAMDIESEALSQKAVDMRPSGERQAKRDSDQSES